jgi:hypothetical protein
VVLGGSFLQLRLTIVLLGVFIIASFDLSLEHLLGDVAEATVFLVHARNHGLHVIAFGRSIS